jgi:hypothetical protein
MRLRACILAIAVVTPLRAFAQDPPPAAPAAPPAPVAEAVPPAPPPPPPAPPPADAPPPAAVVVTPPPAPAPEASPLKLTWSGLVDSYYMYVFNQAADTNSTTPPGGSRQFDVSSNSFTLALTKVGVNAAIGAASLQVDLGYGASGTIINIANSGNPTPATMGPVGYVPEFIVLQAYGSIALGALTLDFGKFYTTAGAEVVEANKNWLYSRSLLFFNIPLLHTGIRANFKVSDMLTLQGSVVNGWNNDPDNNAHKTIGLSAASTASPMASIYLTSYIGKESLQDPGTSTPGDTRVLVDAVGAFTINDKLGLNVNVDYVKEGDGYTAGAAVMGRFVVSDLVNVAARGEFVRVHNAADVNSDYAEGTVMLGLTLAKNFELRPEFRYDHRNDEATLTFTNAKSSVITGTLGALAYF